MNLSEEILKEHSKKNTIRIVSYIGNDKKRFNDLLTIFLKGDYLLAQRSSWILSYCAIANPSFLKPHFKQLIKKIKEPNIHDAVKRNLVKIWAETPIPEKYYGEIYDICFGYLRSISEPVAIKIHSMTICQKITAIYPELQLELKITIEDMMPFGAGGIIARGKKVLRNLENNQFFK